MAAIDQVGGSLAGGGHVRRQAREGATLLGHVALPSREGRQQRGAAAVAQPRQDGRELGAVRDRLLGGGAGRRRAHVGGEVGQGHVALVADAHDDRHRRGGHRAHHLLVVERPQVLQRAAAARQDDQVDPRLCVDALQRAHDAARRGGALHDRRREDDVGQRIAAAQDVADVAPDGADRRGHDPDPARPARQLPLAAILEQALGGQLGAQRLVALVQVAGARRA